MSNGGTRDRAPGFRLSSNTIANLALVVTCIIVAAVVLMRQQETGPAAREDVWPRGTPAAEPIAQALAPWGQQTVIVFVHSRCRYCTSEMPFFQELAGYRSSSAGVRLVFAGSESDETLRTYLGQFGLASEGRLSVKDVPGLAATPTVLLIGHDGRVAGSWQGVMSNRQKARLKRQL